MEGKSSLGRLGLLTHATAGFVDPGFSGHVTLELSNVATLPIKLWPGMKIGQLCFFRLSSAVENPYGSAQVRLALPGPARPDREPLVQELPPHGRLTDNSGRMRETHSPRPGRIPDDDAAGETRARTPTALAPEVDQPRAVVLVLHGGKSRSRRPVRPWHKGAVLRMVPFAGAVAKAGGGAIAVAMLRYAVRGWNGAARPAPLADTRLALEQIAAKHPGVPIGLLGHSMGGRVALAPGRRPPRRRRRGPRALGGRSDGTRSTGTSSCSSCTAPRPDDLGAGEPPRGGDPRGAA